MKNTLIGALLAVSILVTAPVCASDVNSPVPTELGSNYSVTAPLKWAVNQVVVFRKNRPVVTGVILTLAVVAALHKLTNVCDNEEAREKYEDLI
jgi:hypothetical protein